jgi:hypothetical protein
MMFRKRRRKEFKVDAFNFPLAQICSISISLSRSTTDDVTKFVERLKKMTFTFDECGLFIEIFHSF